MSFPSRIGIATGGYRTGQSEPGRICIATCGYRCPEAVPPVTILAGDGGASQATRDEKMLLEILPMALVAIEQIEGGE